ncbi:MAG: class I SAM-dependent DNA methyltransferase [Mastigocoleus sp. MO_167.B18]|uniref:type I restriction-modification system subunit M n=1 Tax=Mastigocoleus sp. MO_188.B34 TaxID=3036635 RepID=UPI00262E10C8|nr:class I SAM-dependent DNA methyltransferase [Mastigocoleus sp. MO_188.B34]MDJ0696038.1 class I SAM-dependent DNA methyltransferase [Mastigocoleus sp. MO_188.B34]MDJ0772239.1 class I SAM-dependent DNA methyltransferase [Mastigocoleus sp. MO_167.B18]
MAKLKDAAKDKLELGFLMARTEKVGQLANFIWSVADLLRGDYKQADYGKVILPFTVLRRLDCVLEPTKKEVLDFFENKVKSLKIKNPEPLLNQKAGVPFHNTSRFTFEELTKDAENVAPNLKNFINYFSSSGREIIDYFNFNDHITRLDEADLLFLVIKKFAEVDLHPNVVSNMEMGYVFEELIRKFSELSNETAGEHFTPREVIRLMVNLLFINDRDILTQEGIVKTIYDPACGTGGMLSVSEEYIKELNIDAKPVVFGQEINPESYAICKSDMLIKGQNVSNIKFGNTFTSDGLVGETFDYILSNPPFGVEWKKVQTHVRAEYEKKGFDGRFGAGLPRISDGSFLFLQHMISKMKRDNGGSRIAIVFNGSPLFSGSAGSGESEIRRWIIENDLLEAIVALPDQLFYNTGIYTYIWVVTNKKIPERKGKIQLINAINYYKKMSRSLGNKRNEIGDGQDNKPDQIAEITKIYGAFQDNERRRLEVDGKEKDVVVSKIFDNKDFGYWRITVERPLRLNFQVTQERIAKVESETGFAKLASSKKKGEAAAKEEIKAGEKLQAEIKQALQTLGDKLYKNRNEFEKDVTKALKGVNGKVSAPVKKAILNGLSERDETADICTDKDGNAEADTDLRDYENVPLKDDINEYMKREVLPHLPDAWVDESKTKVGYEIPFTRHFYEYVPPRDLKEIELEIKELEEEIRGMLEEIL